MRVIIIIIIYLYIYFDLILIHFHCVFYIRFIKEIRKMHLVNFVTSMVCVYSVGLIDQKTPIE
jgi:hypothetical protein